jgi:hypothetical protein
MATDRQIQANRANALKSTGPITPEGKRISSRNAARPSLIAGTVVLQRESVRRFNDLAAALTLELNPRNSIETSLVQTMAAARWHLLRIWGIQTAGFELEMAAIQQKPNAAATSGAALAAITFRTLADNSRALALEHRFEIAFDRQYNRALAMLLKLRQAPDSNPDSISGEAAPGYPAIDLTTETWGDTFEDENFTEANFGPESEEDTARHE